jgi:hypothetical protein
VARDLIRRVQADCSVEVDANTYSVPWRLIGASVRVTVTGEILRVFHGMQEVAVHQVIDGRRQRIVDDAHFEGLAGAGNKGPNADPKPKPPRPLPQPALLRSLAEYEAHVGGGF